VAYLRPASNRQSIIRAVDELFEIERREAMAAERGQATADSRPFIVHHFPRRRVEYAAPPA
jgi:hypothetical protein